AAAKPGLFHSERQAWRTSRKMWFSHSTERWSRHSSLASSRSSEFVARATFSFGAAQAAVHIVSNLLIDMEPKFGVHAPFPVAAAEGNSHSLVSRTSEMAAHSRFQPAVSDSSWRRPSRVTL